MTPLRVIRNEPSVADILKTVKGDYRTCTHLRPSARSAPACRAATSAMAGAARMNATENIISMPECVRIKKKVRNLATQRFLYVGECGPLQLKKEETR